MSGKNNYNSIYRGIIIQNNDPNHAGLVKVWVPGISPTVYRNFNSQNENIKIKLLGLNVNSQLTHGVLQELRNILPWCYLGMPIINEGTLGRYNTYTKTYTSGDGNELGEPSIDKVLIKNVDNYDEQNEINISNSEKPGNIFENDNYKLNDAFNEKNNLNHRINPYSYNYFNDVYSNASTGSFGIPRVGTHVIVQFFDGDPQKPIVTHILYGKTDWDSIYSNEDYPGTYENKLINGEYNHNVEKYRSKYVLNQKGGTIIINNTDNNEKIKFSHYSGSFKEFNNKTNIELAVNNDQKLVLGDQFETIKGYKSNYTAKNFDNIILGDYYETIGNQNLSAFQEWKKEMTAIADIKQLFDIQRTTYENVISDGTVNIINYNSTLQTKAGTNAINPNAGTRLDINDYTSAQVASIIANNAIIDCDSTGSQISNTLSSLKNEGTPPLEANTNINGLSPSTMDGVYNIDQNKINISQQYEIIINKLVDYEKFMGLGGSKIINITKDKIETIGMVMNDYGSIRIDNVGKMYNGKIYISTNCCFPFKQPSPVIEYVNVPSLPGGSYTLNVCDRFNILIGAGGINIKSLGCANLAGTITNIAGEQINIGSNNEINISSEKRIDIAAKILSIRQKDGGQVLVDSSLGISKNILIGGGAYITGETYLTHVTAPLEYQLTDQVKIIGITDVASGPGPHQHIFTFTHNHSFPNLPLSLYNSNSNMRIDAMNNFNDIEISTLSTISASAVPPQARYHGYKTPKDE